MPTLPLPRLSRRGRRIVFSGCLLWLALTAPGALLAADARPVSVQDLCLLVRSGYTDGEVLRETASRPLLQPIDLAAEQALRAAGADQPLIDALKASRRPATAAEALAAREQRAAQDQRAAQQAALVQPRPAVAAPASPPVAGDPQAIANLLHGKLAVFRDERIAAADGSALEGKTLIGLYYARLASKTAAPFSAALAQFYRTTVPKHPEFEIVLISGDPSLYSMENFMRQARMPWLALAYEQIPQVPVLSRLQDPNGASRFVVIDNFGRVHADYHITADSAILPQILPDLAKLIADPALISTLAPPPGAKPAPPAGPPVP